MACGEEKTGNGGDGVGFEEGEEERALVEVGKLALGDIYEDLVGVLERHFGKIGGGAVGEEVLREAGAVGV